MKVSLFCMVGQHEGPTVDIPEGPGAELPLGWRMLKVCYEAVTGRWQYNPKGLATIAVCPRCRVVGDPKRP